MVQLFLYIWLATIPLILAGCGLGPSMIKDPSVKSLIILYFDEKNQWVPSQGEHYRGES